MILGELVNILRFTIIVSLVLGDIEWMVLYVCIMCLGPKSNVANHHDKFQYGANKLDGRMVVFTL